MSCVMPRNNASESAASLGDAESYARLCRELDEGLHALAQPLTILRGIFCALTMGDAVPPQTASRYLEISSTEVERMCDMLSGLRSLLARVQPEPACTEIEFPELDEQARITERSKSHTLVHES
jgi:signal transduction histidine kinase